MRKIIFILLFLSLTVLGVKFEEKIPEKYVNSIKYLIEKDIIKGFPDGSLKINWAITQSELITLISRCNIKYGKESIKSNFLDYLKDFYIKIKGFFKKENKLKFYQYQDKWFHPYLIEYANITGIDEKNIEPLLYVNIYEALYYIIMASPFKGEIENIKLPLNDSDKAKILISAISHKYFVEGVSFKERISRGDAFILIENYLRKVEDAFNNWYWKH